MKLIGKIAMTVAVCMLMVHTLIPHHHVSQDSEEEHFLEYAQADSFLDYIKLALHLNPGENHLEEFEKASSLAVSFLVSDIPLFEISVPTNLNTDDFSFEETNVLAKDQTVFLSISFRGPPQLV